jgi:Uma2 family endonuclease
VEDGGLGEVATAEAGFLIARSPDTVRAPDVAFIASDRIPPAGTPESYWPFAPDLAIEVVSPTDRWTDVEEKACGWLRAGTRLTWIVDPLSLCVHVRRSSGSVLHLCEDDVLDGEDVVPGFSVRIGDLFA